MVWLPFFSQSFFVLYSCNDTEETKIQKQDEYAETVSDKIDKVVTNKYLGLPIFALIMFIMYLQVLKLWIVAQNYLNVIFMKV